MDKSKRFTDIILSGLEIPPLAAGGCARIELYANKEASIEGCKGILEYDSEKISLNLGSICASFYGTDLTVRSFDSDAAIVCGNFCTLEFSQ